MSCLIHYFCGVGNIFECFKLLEKMMHAGPTPNVVTYNAVIDGLCKNHLLRTACRVLRQFKHSRTFPDTTTYNILIKTALSAKEYAVAKELFNDLYSQGLEPGAVTYRSLISAICKDGNIRVALELCNWMHADGCKPSVDMYNMILKAMLQKRMFRDVFLLLKDMRINGCEPDDMSYVILKHVFSDDEQKNYFQAKNLPEYGSPGLEGKFRGEIIEGVDDSEGCDISSSKVVEFKIMETQSQQRSFKFDVLCACHGFESFGSKSLVFLADINVNDDLCKNVASANLQET
ncbi:pentatricopeptide repeat-containing protein At3g04760, chloroplastic-like [Spinacia oleracea]|uniref:Pentatricopeptide repeat-containing protein At3g04760, chloroplastic-like n=1 Tax=Spinacia oleracea TaxID=3562 RepID=A0A9R0J9H8_SPIOL|nr:pentatricopeptide repeat-containing protein At3g04760, chloroplastic-like [Spinacia oleracea]